MMLCSRLFLQLKLKLQLVCVVFVISLPVVLFSENNIHFENISVEQGLSQISVNCLLQDRNGFMWFGTLDGLNKYNGYNFKIYQYEIKDPSTLSHNSILSIFEDRSGLIWIGTDGGGLNRYDPKTNQFKHYKYDPQNAHSISDNRVTAIFEDKSNILWIGTINGLNKFDPKEQQFFRYFHDPENTNSLGNNYIQCLCEVQTGDIWIGTGGGGISVLSRNNQGKDQFTHIKRDPKNLSSLINNTVNSILQDNTGMIWIATNGGLDKYDPGKKQFTHFQNDPDNPKSLINNTVNSILQDSTGMIWIGTNGGLDKYDPGKEQFVHYMDESFSITTFCKDRTGVLWIGTIGSGIYKFYREKENFLHYNRDLSDTNSLISNVVWSFCEDSRGILWIGTVSGLDQFDRSKNQFIHYTNDPQNPNSLSNNDVRSIHEDQSGALWIGTSGGGLNKLNRDRNQFKRFLNNPRNPTSLSHNFVSIIFEDRKKMLWIGTYGGGLNKFDRHKGECTRYVKDPNDINSLAHNYVNVIYEDRTGKLWIGTRGGLDKFDQQNNCFIHYKNDPDNPNSLSYNLIFSILEDQSGMLWIGTYGGGLNRLNPRTETFTHFTEKDGLPNDAIYGLLMDKAGNIWISTNNGLSQFNPETQIFKNFNISDGLQSKEFDRGAYYKSIRTGEMFFGGVNGFNAFFPDKIKDNPFIPQIVITDFKLFNTSVLIGEKIDDRIILTKSITETDKIEISYKQNVLSFEFAALHYISPEKNQYAYMMEELDKDWNYVNNRRFASYTGIPPGKYTFRVKASNNDGVWNEKGASIKITITPPFWQTWWFRTLIAIFIIGIAFSWYKMKVRNLERQKQKLEKQVKERTTEIRHKNKQLEKKNEQILSSIRYGERIQNAILPLTEKIRSSIPQHFILYKPRDIVSGDFYWFNQIDGKIVLAVVDCTGHGVPGAFMSMMGNAFLNEIVTEQKIMNPSLILKRLHEEVRTALKQKQEKVDTQDGMDVCLCVLEKNSHTQKLLFAGAKRPLFVFKKGESKLTEVKGDRKSIGGKQREEKREFTGHELKVRKGDRLYLTTDGFADQQNSKNRRYGSRRLKTFLQSVFELEMQEQEKVLAQELTRHQGREEQRDDITVMGVRV